MCLFSTYRGYLRTLLVTSVAAGRVGDLIGRKGTLFVGAIVFTIGGIIQTFTTGFWSMIVGRLISGFGVGLLSCDSIPYTIRGLRLPDRIGLLFPYIRVRYPLLIMYVQYFHSQK